MATCAVQISEDCCHNIPRSGMCKKCREYLIREGYITGNESYGEYPEWLLVLLRSEHAIDNESIRHPSNGGIVIGYIGDDKYNGVRPGRAGKVTFRRRGCE